MACLLTLTHWNAEVLLNEMRKHRLEWCPSKFWNTLAGDSTWLISGWWFGTWMDYVSIYWECHHPNWRTYIFQRDWNHQSVYNLVARNRIYTTQLEKISWIHEWQQNQKWCVLYTIQALTRNPQAILSTENMLHAFGYWWFLNLHIKNSLLKHIATVILSPGFISQVPFTCKPQTC